jgi:hypothetical protein
MYRIFGSEGGFGDSELRIIQSTIRRPADWESSLPDTTETSKQESPLPPAERESAA